MIAITKRDTFQPKRQALANGGGEPLLEGVFIYVRKRKKYFVDDMKEMINNKDE